MLFVYLSLSEVYPILGYMKKLSVKGAKKFIVYENVAYITSLPADLGNS